jgi:hypothetical protein
MRCNLLFCVVLFGIASARLNVAAQPPTNRDRDVIHSVQGIGGPIEVESVGRYNRLIINDILWGMQFNNKFVRHWLDDLGFLVPGSPWDIVTIATANALYNPREEPLTYYHRTGPVGAIFRELRTRRNGADATAPVGILGLGAGTEAAYALSLQEFTYYETDPALKSLVADSDKYFTFIADARKRKAEITVITGKRRDKLKEQVDRRYVLLMVDQAETYPFSTDVFTKEAIELYFNRLVGDGIVALQISNKYINLEPMFAQLAKELKLESRIWDDTQDSRVPGKTGSSWIVLARSKRALGTLGWPVKDQLDRYGARYRPLESAPGITAWTDSKADVLSLMIDPVFHIIRPYFGLPNR